MGWGLPLQPTGLLVSVSVTGCNHEDKSLFVIIKEAAVFHLTKYRHWGSSLFPGPRTPISLVMRPPVD